MRRASILPLFVLLACHDAPPPDARTPAPPAPPEVPAPSAASASPSAAPSSSASAAAKRVSAAPAELALDPASPCKLRGATDGALTLSLHGKPFAVVHQVSDLEVFASPAGATARGRARELEFVAEVNVRDLHVVTKTRPNVDGASLVTSFQAQSLTAASELTGSVVAPLAIGGARSDVSRACADLVVADGDVALEGDARTLRANANGKLLDAPGGNALAEVHVGGKPLDVRLLERRGASAHVLMPGDGAVARGWIDARLLVPLPESRAAALSAEVDQMQMQMLSTLSGTTAVGVLSSDSTLAMRSCRVPVYVRDGDALFVVGRKNVATQPAGDDGADEVPIDLGPHGADARVAFIRRSERAACPSPPGVATQPSLPSVSPPPRGPQANVQVGAVTASAPVADAARVLAGLRPKMRACYEAGLASHPDARGSLSIVAKLKADGEVESVSATPTDAGAQDVAFSIVTACVSRAVGRAQFAAPGAPSAVTFPVLFQTIP